MDAAVGWESEARHPARWAGGRGTQGPPAGEVLRAEDGQGLLRLVCPTGWAEQPACKWDPRLSPGSSSRTAGHTHTGGWG